MQHPNEIHDLANDGNLPEIQRLIAEQGVDILLQPHERWGLPPIVFAAIKGDSDLVNYLLNHVAGEHYTTHLTYALIYASSRGELGLVQSLLSLGADVNGVDPRDGSTALMLACEKGQPEAVQILLDHGALVDVVSQKGNTALIWAAQEGHADCIQLLLEHGAAINAANIIGRTVLDRAQANVRHLLLIPSVFATLESTDWINADPQLFEVINVFAALSPSPLMVAFDNVFKNRAKGCFKLSDNGQCRLLYLLLMLVHGNKQRWGINNHERDKGYAALCQYIGEHFYAVHREIVAISNQGDQAPLRTGIVFLSMAKQFFSLSGDQQSTFITDSLLVNAFMALMGLTVNIQLNGSALEQLITADPDAFIATIDELRSHLLELCCELDVDDMGLSEALFVRERELALQAKIQQQTQQFQAFKTSQSEAMLFSVKRKAEGVDEMGGFEPTKKIKKTG